MEQLEREVREMLKEKAGGLPNEYEASTEVIRRASRRRTMKMVGIGVTCAIVAIGVASVIAQSATTKKGQTVVTAPKTRVTTPATTRVTTPVTTPATTPGKPARAKPSGPKVITMSGKIGSLQLGTSTEADVRAALGAPDATATGDFGAGFPSFRGLGYDCTTGPSAQRDPLVLQPTTRGPYCKTIYYINATTNTLGAFSTTANTYTTEKSTSVGVTESDAANYEGQKSSTGCDTGIHLGQPERIFINVGTKPTDRVNRITVELPTNAVGALFC